MSSRHFTLITRLRGTLVEPDLGGSLSDTRKIALAIFADEPDSATAIQARTWEDFSVDDPDSGYDMQDVESQLGAYVMNTVGQAAITALLKTGRRYRFEWTWVYAGVTQREQKTVTWQVEPSSAFPRSRATAAPMRFTPLVNEIAIDPDSVTLSATVRVRAGLVLKNLTVTADADFSSWTEVATTPAPLGTWDNATVYTVGQLVNLSSVTYIAQTTTVAGESPAATAWTGASVSAGTVRTQAGVAYRSLVDSNTAAVSDTASWLPIWRTILTTASQSASLPTYAAVRVRDGYYGFSDADAATILATLRHGNEYQATWTYVYGGVTYTSVSTFVHQVATRMPAAEKRFFTRNFGQIKDMIFRFLGAEPATAPFDDFVNEATLAFFQDAPWAFPESDTVYLDIYAGSTTIEFPEDFASHKLVSKAGDTVHRFQWVTDREMADLRERNWINTSNLTYCYIRSDTPIDDASPVRRVLEIYPTFSTTTPSGVRLDYMRLPPVMVEDTDVPPIPTIAFPIYLQFLRMWAAEKENEETAPDERRRYEAMIGAAMRADERQANPHLGSMQPARDASGDFCGDRGYLPVNPDQGPSYT